MILTVRFRTLKLFLLYYYYYYYYDHSIFEIGRVHFSSHVSLYTVYVPSKFQKLGHSKTVSITGILTEQSVLIYVTNQ